MASDMEGVSLETVKVDTSKGSFSDSVQILRYLSGAAAYDGVSTFDQKHQVLYFAVDFQSSFIFAIDTVHNTVLPPISIPGVSWTIHLQWDQPKGRIFALTGFDQNTVNYVISFGTSGNLPTMVIANLTSTGFKYFEFAAFDWTQENYYFSYYDNTGQKVGYFNVDKSLSSLKSFQVTCPAHNASLHYLYYDNSHTTLIAVVDIGENAFYFVQLNSDGSNCKSSVLKLIDEAIILGGTYDTSKQTLYLSVAVNGGPSLLYTYHTQTAQLTSTQTQDALSDIQISM